MLFKYDRVNNKLIPIEETTFSSEGLSELQNIEIWIKNNPSILTGNDDEDQIMIVGEQKTSETKKRLDLLGVDRFGNIVIIELKRDLAQPMTEFQAITYASYVIYNTFDDICNIYAEYLNNNKTEFGLPENINFLEKAKEDLRNFCPDINQDNFNKNQRIILVAGDFHQDLLSAVTWLVLKGIKIECIKLSLYKYNNVLFIQPKKILPTPDISENIVRIKLSEKDVSEENNKSRQEDQILYVDIDAHYKRLLPPLNEYLRSFVDELTNMGINVTNLTKMGFHLIKGSKKIMISTGNKAKIEFRFSKAKKEEIQEMINDLKINNLTVKDKADIEPYAISNPTPSIDLRKDDDIQLFEDIKKVCKKWLEL
jgi:hypothetical protein